MEKTTLTKTTDPNHYKPQDQGDKHLTTQSGTT